MSARSVLVGGALFASPFAVVPAAVAFWHELSLLGHIGAVILGLAATFASGLVTLVSLAKKFVEMHDLVVDIVPRLELLAGSPLRPVRWAAKAFLAVFRLLGLAGPDGAPTPPDGGGPRRRRIVRRRPDGTSVTDRRHDGDRSGPSAALVWVLETICDWLFRFSGLAGRDPAAARPVAAGGTLRASLLVGTVLGSGLMLSGPATAAPAMPATGGAFMIENGGYCRPGLAPAPMGSGRSDLAAGFHIAASRGGGDGIEINCLADIGNGARGVAGAGTDGVIDQPIEATVPVEATDAEMDLVLGSDGNDTLFGGTGDDIVTPSSWSIARSLSRHLLDADLAGGNGDNILGGDGMRRGIDSYVDRIFAIGYLGYFIDDDLFAGGRACAADFRDFAALFFAIEELLPSLRVTRREHLQWQLGFRLSPLPRSRGRNYAPGFIIRSEVPDEAEGFGVDDWLNREMRKTTTMSCSLADAQVTAAVNGPDYGSGSSNNMETGFVFAARPLPNATRIGGGFGSGIGHSLYRAESRHPGGYDSIAIASREFSLKRHKVWPVKFGALMREGQESGADGDSH
jgi:hypothetical protein